MNLIILFNQICFTKLLAKKYAYTNAIPTTNLFNSFWHEFKQQQLKQVISVLSESNKQQDERSVTDSQIKSDAVEKAEQRPPVSSCKFRLYACLWRHNAIRLCLCFLQVSRQLAVKTLILQLAKRKTRRTLLLLMLVLVRSNLRKKMTKIWAILLQMRWKVKRVQ